MKKLILSIVAAAFLMGCLAPGFAANKASANKSSTTITTKRAKANPAKKVGKAVKKMFTKPHKKNAKTTTAKPKKAMK